MAEDWVRRIGRGREVFAWASERAANVRGVGHAGLCVAHRIVHGADDGVYAHLSRLEGVDLHDVGERRGKLSLGELVWIGTQVLSALAAMHQHGLVHGDISASNVMVVGGSCVVVDTLALPSERGTPGFVDPNRGSVADSHDDVYAVAALLRSLAGVGDRDVVHAWTAPLMNPRGSRVSAAVAASTLSTVAPARPVRTTSESRSAVSPRVRTIKLEHGTPWRVRRAVTTVAAVLLAVVVTGGAGALATPSRHLEETEIAVTEQVGTYTPVMPVPDFADRGADIAAITLTHARMDAVARGDIARLLATTVEGSPAREHAQAVAVQLESGVVWDGLRVRRLDAEVVWHQGNAALVHVTYTVAPHSVAYPDGSIDIPSESVSVLLDLVWTDAGWLVEDARADLTSSH